MQRQMALMRFELAFVLLLATGCGAGAPPLPSVPIATASEQATMRRQLQSLPANPVLVALGDSISYNWPPGSQSFPNFVGAYFGVPSEVLAVPGATCTDVLIKQIPALPANAGYITLDCGSNDNTWNGNTPSMPSPGLFAQVIAALRAQAPQAHIVVITPGIWIDNIAGGPAWIQDEILQAHTTPLIPAIDASQFPVADFLDNIHFSAQGEQDVSLAIEQSFLSY